MVCYGKKNKYAASLARIYESKRMFMDIIPLMNSPMDWLNCNRNDYAPSDKIIAEIVLINYRNKIKCGIECKKDLSNIDKNTNISLSEFYNSERNFQTSFEYLEPISYNSDQLVRGLKKINLYAKYKYTNEAYSLALKISSQEALVKYVCKDIFDIIISYISV